MKVKKEEGSAEVMPIKLPIALGPSGSGAQGVHCACAIARQRMRPEGAKQELTFFLEGITILI